MSDWIAAVGRDGGCIGQGVSPHAVRAPCDLPVDSILVAFPFRPGGAGQVVSQVDSVTIQGPLDLACLGSQWNYGLVQR
mgnify:CR=1 FL=1|jgi:hypothetical protein